MGGQLLDVEDDQPVVAEDVPGDQQGEVREVLVVDGVELVALEQPGQVRELDGGDAAGREQDPHPGHEVVEVGDLGQDVVGDQQVGAPASGHQAPGQVDPEELGEGGHALGGRGRGDVARRFDAQHGDAAPLQVLEQVAVVAGQLDRQAVWPEA